MQNDVSRMGDESITRLLFRFSLPATVGMLVMATYNIVDTIFVGMLGSQAIAALSIALPIQMILGAIGVGTGVGAASLISRSLGAGRKDVAQRAVGQVIFLSLSFGAVTAFAGLHYLKPLLRLFGATPEIMQLTADYVGVIIGGSVMFFLIMGLNNVLRGEGNPRLSMYIMIVSAITNTVLDPVFIFLFGMGVKGAALATVISKIVGVVIMLCHFFSGRSAVTITFHSIIPCLDTIRKIYVIGFSAIIMQVATNISHVIVNNILAGYGHLAIASMGLIFRLLMFALMPIVGISQGLLPIIGYNFGAGNSARIRETLLKGLALSTGIASFMGILYFTVPSLFLSVFTRDAGLIELAGNALRIMVIMFPAVGAQIVFVTFFQATGKGTPSLILSILREVIVFIPFLMVLSRVIGLNGVWISRPASDFCAFLVTFLMIWRELHNQGIPLWKSKLRNDSEASAIS